MTVRDQLLVEPLSPPTQYVTETGATAQGTYLQAITTAPRVTWDNKGMAAYATLHPDVLVYRKVGEPSVQIRARSAHRAIIPVTPARSRAD